MLIVDARNDLTLSKQVKKSVCNTAAGGKRVVVILELEIVTPGAQVGAKLGNPQMIGADGEWESLNTFNKNPDIATSGKISAPAANQNTNPNAGAAQKRPAGAASDPPPVKTTPGQVRVSSCVTSSITPASSGPLRPHPAVLGHPHRSSHLPHLLDHALPEQVDHQSKVLTFDTASTLINYQQYINYQKFTKIIDLMKSTTKSSIQVFKYRVYKLVITYLLVNNVKSKKDPIGSKNIMRN